MTPAAHQTTEELLATLNADLRKRDPVYAMKQQIRATTLEEVRQRVRDARTPDGADAAALDRLDLILDGLAVGSAGA